MEEVGEGDEEIWRGVRTKTRAARGAEYAQDEDARVT